MTLADGHFAIGYHSPALHWFLASSEPETSITSEVSPSFKCKSSIDNQALYKKSPEAFSSQSP